MAQLEKCLPCTRTQQPSQEPGMIVYACNPEAREAESCRSLGFVAYVNLSDEYQDSERDDILLNKMDIHTHAHIAIRYSHHLLDTVRQWDDSVIQVKLETLTILLEQSL